MIRKLVIELQAGLSAKTNKSRADQTDARMSTCIQVCGFSECPGVFKSFLTVRGVNKSELMAPMLRYALA